MSANAVFSGLPDLPRSATGRLPTDGTTFDTNDAPLDIDPYRYSPTPDPDPTHDPTIYYGDAGYDQNNAPTTQTINDIGSGPTAPRDVLSGHKYRILALGGTYQFRIVSSNDLLAGQDKSCAEDVALSCSDRVR